MDPTSGSLPASTFEYIHSRPIADDYDDFNFSNDLFRFDSDLLDERIVEPGRMLDLGCGTGRLLARFAGRGFDVTGFDISEHMLRVAEKKLKDVGLGAKLIHGDMRDLSGFRDNSFDNVVCMFSTLGMIRGSRARRSIVEQVLRLLAPGGTFFVHAHNRWHRCYRLDRVAWLLQSAVAAVVTDDEMGDLWMSTYRDIPNMYLHVFSAREMEDLLYDSGFCRAELVCINDMRNDKMKGTRLRDIRSNGFIGIGTK